MSGTDTSSWAPRLGVIAIALVVVFLLGAALGGCVDIGWFGGGEAYEDVGTTIVDRVQAIAELATVEMVEFVTIEKGNDYGWLNWVRGDRIFMLVGARIGAGVDLADLTPAAFDVDTETGVVTVDLPPSRILFVDVDERNTQVYERDTGLFTKGDPQLESDAREVAEEVLVQAALDRGILDLATDHAETALRQLLLGAGYRQVVFRR